MIRSAQILCLSLTMLCFAMLLPPSAVCAQEQGRYIKLIGVDDKQITLDVDGKKLNIPLPEGYEVASRDLYAKLYESLERKAKNVNDILLCVLINSYDDKIRQQDPTFNLYRYCLFSIDNDYSQHRFGKGTFKYEIQNLKEILPILTADSNQHLEKENLSPFSYKFIFENNFAISQMRIEERPSQERDRIGFTNTYFVVDSLAITFLLYHDICDQADIDKLMEETLLFVRSVSR